MLYYYYSEPASLLLAALLCVVIFIVLLCANIVIHAGNRASCFLDGELLAVDLVV